MSELLAKELTAETAARVALLSNRSLQATLEELGIARADLAQSRLLENPDLDVDAVPLSGGISEFALHLDLLDVLTLPLRGKIASVQLEQVKLRVGDEMLRLIAETKAAAYTLQARQQLVGRLELIREINEAAAELAKRQHAAGNINDLDLANQSAAYNQSKVDVAMAAVEVRADRERLNRLMGLWGPATSWRIAPQLPPIPAEGAALEGLESIAIRQRMDVAAARFGVDLVGRGLALKKGTRFLPVGFDVGVAGEKEEGKRLVGPTVRLQLPIVDIGRASIARLESELRQARWQLEALAVNARSEVRQARDAMLAARDVARYYEKVLLPERVQILDQTLRQYNFMLTGAYELLAARQSEVAAERAYVEAWRDYWIARTELERAVGGRLDPAKTAEPTPAHIH